MTAIAAASVHPFPGTPAADLSVRSWPLGCASRVSGQAGSCARFAGRSCVFRSWPCSLSTPFHGEKTQPGMQGSAVWTAFLVPYVSTIPLWARRLAVSLPLKNVQPERVARAGQLRERLEVEAPRLRGERLPCAGDGHRAGPDQRVPGLRGVGGDQVQHELRSDTLRGAPSETGSEFLPHRSG